MNSARGCYKEAVIPGRRIQAPIEPCGSLWPNGEFSIGYAPGGGLEETVAIGEDRSVGGGSGLDLAMPLNSHTDLGEVGERRGQRGLTSRGARMVRNAAEAMESTIGRENLTFATLTLPDMSYEDFWNVSGNWAEVVRVFYQRLGRFLKRYGLSAAYVAVTELQPRRTRREGIPALHLHLIFQGKPRHRGGWAVPPVLARKWWSESVHLHTVGRYDFSHSENLQQVRESSAGYLSKYMSKGGELGEPIKDNEMGWSLPTAWYNVSLKLKRYVMERVCTSPEMMEILEAYWRLGSMEFICDYFYEGVIEECRGPGPHFCIGRIKEPDLKDIREIYRAQQQVGT